MMSEYVVVYVCNSNFHEFRHAVISKQFEMLKSFAFDSFD